MQQKHLNLIFGAAIISLLLFGAWRFAVAPYACPVPAPLTSFKDDVGVPCFEFWFARYQALLAACVALAGVYVAVRPVWRQVALQNLQHAREYRTSLKEVYKMLTEAQKTIDWSSWNPNEDCIPHPNSPEFTAKFGSGFEDGRAALYADFAQRQVRLEAMFATLRGLVVGSIASAEIEKTAAGLTTRMATLRQEADAAELPVPLNVTDAQRDTMKLSQLWHYLVQMPDLGIPYGLRQLDRKLEELKGATVDEISKGPPT